MSGNFTKLDAGLTESTLWSEPDRTRLVWITMLARCDRFGRVLASVPGLAHLARVPIEDTEKALQAFLAPDPYSRTKDHGGRRIEEIDGGWRLLNHEKYRALRTDEDRKEQNRLAQARARERKRLAEASAETLTHADVADESAESAHTDADADADAKKGKRSAPRRGPPPARPEDVNEQTWNDWLQLRREKRASVTKTTVSEAQLEAGKAGLTLERFLAVWCARGSQGLQADWLKPHERGNGNGSDVGFGYEATGGLASRKPGPFGPRVPDLATLDMHAKAIES